MKLIDPTIFNLNKRTVIEQKSNSLYIVVNRKSRIIMKDGKRLLEQAKQIKKTLKMSVSVVTTAPVCSKTSKYLKANAVEIIQQKRNQK